MKKRTIKAKKIESAMTSLLSSFICKVFDNEPDFVARFYNSEASAEVTEFYMASERCRVTYLLDCGQHVTTTIRTDEFIEWCEQI